MRQNEAKNSFKLRSFVPYGSISRYLCDIFSESAPSDGYVCFRSGRGSDTAQSWLGVDKIRENIHLELARHDYYDTFFSFATFQKSRHPQRTVEKANALFAWSVDIDYKNGCAHPLDVYEYIAGELCIPKPNYIEYGHRLRLVYIFKEPLRLFPKQKDRLLSAFNFVQSYFARVVNEQLGFDGSFGAEANHAATFFRIPCSVNSKDGSEIKIKHITNERLSLQELFEEWIPNSALDASGNKDVWYENWKKKNEDGKSKSAKKHSHFSLWEKRVSVFKQMRTMPNPHRKRLCRLYGNALIQLGLISTSEEYEMEVWEFNEGFEHPLTKKEFRRYTQWNAKNLKAYAYSDRKIAEELGTDCPELLSLTKKERDAACYKKKRNEKIEMGLTKAQQIEKRKMQIKALSNFFTQEQIAKKLGLSLSTVKRDFKKIKEENTLFKKRTLNYAMKIRAAFLKKLGAAKRELEDVAFKINENLAHSNGNGLLSRFGTIPQLGVP